MPLEPAEEPSPSKQFAESELFLRVLQETAMAIDELLEEDIKCDHPEEEKGLLGERVLCMQCLLAKTKAAFSSKAHPELEQSLCQYLQTVPGSQEQTATENKQYRQMLELAGLGEVTAIPITKFTDPANLEKWHYVMTGFRNTMELQRETRGPAVAAHTEKLLELHGQMVAGSDAMEISS